MQNPQISLDNIVRIVYNIFRACVGSFFSLYGKNFR